MTPKQIYQALARIAGHTCSHGEMFLEARRVRVVDLQVIQSLLHSLIEKVDVDRSHRDFGRAYGYPRTQRQRHASLRRSRQVTRRIMGTPPTQVVPREVLARDAREAREARGMEGSVARMTPPPDMPSVEIEAMRRAVDAIRAIPASSPFYVGMDGAPMSVEQPTPLDPRDYGWAYPDDVMGPGTRA